MIIDTVEVRFLEDGDFVIINGEECKILCTVDFEDVIIVDYTDEMGDTCSIELNPFTELEIWGN